MEVKEGIQVLSYGVEIPAPEGDRWIAVLKSVLMADAEATKVLVKRIEELEETLRLVDPEELEEAEYMKRLHNDRGGWAKKEQQT